LNKANPITYEPELFGCRIAGLFRKATRSGGSFGLLLVSARSEFVISRFACWLPPSLWGELNSKKSRLLVIATLLLIPPVMRRVSDFEFVNCDYRAAAAPDMGSTIKGLITNTLTNPPAANQMTIEIESVLSLYPK
jgi:hypothetical protein